MTRDQEQIRAVMDQVEGEEPPLQVEVHGDDIVVTMPRTKGLSPAGSARRLEVELNRKQQVDAAFRCGERFFFAGIGDRQVAIRQYGELRPTRIDADLPAGGMFCQPKSVPSVS